MLPLGAPWKKAVSYPFFPKSFAKLVVSFPEYIESTKGSPMEGMPVMTDGKASIDLRPLA